MTHLLAGLKPGKFREVTVCVTQDDIDRGQPLDCWECPLAVALRRMFPGFVPEVDTIAIYLNQEKLDGSLYPVFRAGVTQEIDDFIDAVDMRDEDVLGPQDFTMTFTRTG